MRESADSTHLIVTKDNTAPYPIQGLSAAKLPSGDTQLTWTRPSPEDPDGGDSVQFFRIYRDGILMANRYERYFDSSGSPTVVWSDINTNGVAHAY